jgi:hypothetical protein
VEIALAPDLHSLKYDFHRYFQSGSGYTRL